MNAGSCGASGSLVSKIVLSPLGCMSLGIMQPKRSKTFSVRKLLLQGKVLQSIKPGTHYQFIEEFGRSSGGDPVLTI